MVAVEDKSKLHLEDLKSGGFIKERKKDLFTVRLRVPGGRLPFEKMERITEVAKKYGKYGYVHISVRQSIEIVGVHFDDIDAVIKELKEVGQKIASCGARVRVPTACGGCEYNPNGIMDAQKKVLEVDEKFFGRECNHKFKIGFSGCPIDCIKTREMDLGFQGMVEPEWIKEDCIGCKLCAKACLESAITSDKDGKPIFDIDKCISCGDCINMCPTDAWKAKRKGWHVRVGGKHGRHPRKADNVFDFLPDEKVHDFIESTVTWYNKNASGRERIGNCFDRVGLGKYIKEAVDDFKEKD
ncbi:MAG: 4Fe-4S dicluster domain-containing protein [Candidatus Anammoxibacter sp.]